MTWTDPRTWVTGELVTAALLNTHLRDNLKALSDPWTSYTPTWTGASGNPAIGNGALVGKYTAAGKMVHFRINLTIGSTTTLGSGQYSLGLPVAAHGTGLQIAAGHITSGSSVISIWGRIAAGASAAALWCPPTTAGAFDRAVTGAIPLGLTTGAVVQLQGVYEAA